jgi:hypothetical protein
MARPDTIVCRCEDVTFGTLQRHRGWHAAKLETRCGMGPCQGRMCGLTVTELIAQALGVSPVQTGYYRLRFPIKPITLGELAALPQTTASVDAVVRVPKPPVTDA